MGISKREPTTGSDAPNADDAAGPARTVSGMRRSSSSLAPTSYAHVARRTLTFPVTDTFLTPEPSPAFESRVERIGGTYDPPPPIDTRYAHYGDEAADAEAETRRKSGTMPRPAIAPPAPDPAAVVGGADVLSDRSLDLMSDRSVDDGWDDDERPSDRTTVPTGLSDIPDVPESGSDVDETQPIAALPSAEILGFVAPMPPPFVYSSDASLDTLVARRLAQLPPVSTEITPVDPDWETKETLRPVALPQLEAEQAEAILRAEERAREEATRRAETAVKNARREQTREQIITAIRQRSWIKQALVPIIVSHVAVAVVIGLIARSSRPLPRPFPRDAHVAMTDRTPLAGQDFVPPAPPPPQGCATAGGSQMLAARAQLGPGIDMTVLDTGFAVGLATKTEAVGVRIEGASGLRVAETVRVKAATAATRVTVDPGHEEDAIDVRIDSDEARTVIGAEAPAFKVVARGGIVVATTDEPKITKTLWAPPGVNRVTLAAPAQRSVYRPVLARLDSPPKLQPLYATEVVRAAPRADGGAVVALRRPSVLWLGLVDARLSAVAPLVPIMRKAATVGAPAVSPSGTGGAVAWAEKAAGESTFHILVASFTADATGGHVGDVHVIDEGMSPSLAQLPDGDLLLAYADGPAGAHRVVARRLGKDLVSRGDAVVISPESINAGQPVAAVRPDGRALVAFFATDKGKPASVLATPVSCDVGK